MSDPVAFSSRDKQRIWQFSYVTLMFRLALVDFLSLSPSLSQLLTVSRNFKTF